MSVRITLVAAARSTSMLTERFDDDRSPDQTGWYEVQLAAPTLVPLNAAELRYCSPTLCSRATAQALGFAPMAQPALRGCDMGRWRGLTLGEVTAVEPHAVDTWLADPRSAPHGGESLLAFIGRIGTWLDTRPAQDGGSVVAVAEPSVIRAALVYVLNAPPTSYWNVDVRPLSTLVLTGRAGSWQLRLQTAC